MSAARCRICGSADLRDITGVRDRVTAERFTVTRCRACGFGVTDPMPADLAPYYPARERAFGAFAALVLRRLYGWRVRGWLAHLPERGTALEVGAGTGWMLAALRARGWRAIGTERTVSAALRARGASGAPVFVGGIDALRPGPTLDLVVMFHVLEHLPDPQRALRDLAERMRPGGTLILGLPNIGSWQARVGGARWWHLDVPRHLVHFTPRSIDLALRAAGLRRTGIDFRSIEHDPLAWAQLAIERAGAEQGFLLNALTGRSRGAGAARTVLLAALAAVVFPIALVLSAATWLVGSGAVMEVRATRDA